MSEPSTHPGAAHAEEPRPGAGIPPTPISCAFPLVPVGFLSEHAQALHDVDTAQRLRADAAGDIVGRAAPARRGRP